VGGPVRQGGIKMHHGREESRPFLGPPGWCWKVTSGWAKEYLGPVLVVRGKSGHLIMWKG
jgi:hypothetical protein